MKVIRGYPVTLNAIYYCRSTLYNIRTLVVLLVAKGKIYKNHVCSVCTHV